MRVLGALLALIVGIAAIGCYHDKYNLDGKKKEEYVIPPDEARFNLPETATWKAPPKKKEQDTLMNKNGGVGQGTSGLGF
jgi:hypothetical protein